MLPGEHQQRLWTSVPQRSQKPCGTEHKVSVVDVKEAPQGGESLSCVPPDRLRERAGGLWPSEPHFGMVAQDSPTLGVDLHDAPSVIAQVDVELARIRGGA